MAEQSSHPIRALSDYASLLYHEARNVRHLIRAGHISVEGWEKIVSLPNNRDEAWKIIQPFRSSAKRTESASECLRVFEQRFDADLSALQEMFADANWRHAKLYGGNAWAQIAAIVSELVQAIRSGKTFDQDAALNALRYAEHNTGNVEAKLQKLDASLS
jgi:hypothetical protein